jgi:spore coat protein A
VDRLPLPSVLQPQYGVYPKAAYYEVGMTQFTQQLHRDLDPTPVWGYHGTYPGPTIETQTNQPVVVKWINDLPTTHLLPIDTTIHGAQPPNPAVRAVVHLHGGNVPPESDGFPEDWFVPGESDTYHYPNAQQAATLWYHDHALGITRLNVYAGLAGFWIIRDLQERLLNLPQGPYEVPLVIQDKSFNADGTLFYPDKGDTHPVWLPEFFGDTALVNGKVWPYLEVEPRRYRVRIINGSQSRFYKLSFSNKHLFWQIGSEGGLLQQPVPLREVLLAPAERADIIVEFARHQGESITLTGNAPAPFPFNNPENPAITEIMQFRVTRPLSGRDTSRVPAWLRSVPRILPRQASVVRNLTLEEVLDPDGNPIMLMLNGAMWDDPITEQPRLGSTEIWRFLNLTMDTHPIHLHLVQFQVLNRRKFDVEEYMATGRIIYLGPEVPPAPNETGWKDTVRANPGESTSIIMRFSSFTGKYVWHCHILEHEDNEMMRPYEVLPRPPC